MAVVNGLSLLGLKLTIFWLTAQMLNHISAQHPLWGRHVLDIIIELKANIALYTGQSCISNQATI